MGGSWADILPFLIPMPALVVVAGIASGSETAVFSLSRHDRDVLRERSAKAAEAIDQLLAAPTRLLVLVLLVNMFANVAYFVLGAVASTRAPDAATAAVVGVGSVLASVVFGEVFAKLLARTVRLAYCRVCGRGLLWIQRFATPVIGGSERGAGGPPRSG